jgi:hypothetical protein
MLNNGHNYKQGPRYTFVYRPQNRATHSAKQEGVTVKRTALTRTRPTPRTKKPNQELAESKAIIWHRSQGLCEVCGDALGNDFDAHHRQSRRTNDHRTVNLIACHRSCHQSVHANPADSMTVGLIVSVFVDPDLVPLALPGGQVVALGDWYGQVTP